MSESTEAKLHFLDYWRVIKLRLGLILLTFFLVMVSAEVYVYFLPRQFYSQVTIEIKPDVNQRITDIGSQNSNVRADPTFIATQIQVLKKAEILDPVIEKLDLVKKLSPAGMTMPLQWIRETLSRSMIVQEQRNTTLVDIGIYHPEPRQLAADIANQIAVTYRDKRIEESKNSMGQTLNEMRDELNVQRDKMAQLFQEASKIRQEDGITDIDPDSAASVPTISSERTVRLIEEHPRIAGAQAAPHFPQPVAAMIERIAPGQAHLSRACPTSQVRGHHLLEPVRARHQGRALVSATPARGPHPGVACRGVHDVHRRCVRQVSRDPPRKTEHPRHLACLHDTIRIIERPRRHHASSCLQRRAERQRGATHPGAPVEVMVRHEQHPQ